MTRVEAWFDVSCCYCSKVHLHSKMWFSYVSLPLSVKPKRCILVSMQLCQPRGFFTFFYWKGRCLFPKIMNSNITCTSSILYVKTVLYMLELHSEFQTWSLWQIFSRFSSILPFLMHGVLPQVNLTKAEVVGGVRGLWFWYPEFFSKKEMAEVLPTNFKRFSLLFMQKPMLKKI